MTETLSREINCLLCKQTFTPVVQPAEGETVYPVHCSSCAQWVPMKAGDPVRVTLREVLGLGPEALALAVQSVLAPCPCGGTFVHDAGQRCPECIDKIRRETRSRSSNTGDFRCLWDLGKLKEFEQKTFAYILEKIESKEDSLNGLIEKFESGKIDPETYMQGLESLQFRESRQIAAIQTWAMMLGPELAFRAAEEHGLVERYGTRILVSIAAALEMSTGRAILSTLSEEKKNWDGPVRKELQTFIAKIGGGF